MAGRPPKPLSNPPNRIREIRLTLGLTQAQLGQRVDVSGEVIRKWETGDSGVSVSQLERLAEALGIKPANLLIPAQHQASRGNDGTAENL
jgi:transcriptional regulator with XRE-family HTH domain